MSSRPQVGSGGVTVGRGAGVIAGAPDGGAAVGAAVGAVGVVVQPAAASKASPTAATRMITPRCVP